MAQSNRYDPRKHDEYIQCPRSRCAARNAPPSSKDYRSSCWNCSTSLPRTDHPVEAGEEIVIDVTDMHESGEGVGKTDEGFVILVDGVVPKARARVRIDNILDTYARATLLERVAGDVESEAEGDADENDSRSSGRRDNYWG